MLIDFIYMHAPLILAFIGLGIMAGLLAGLLGVGGGIIMVPGIYYILSLFITDPSIPIIKIAVVTSLMVILPTGISSAISHYKRQHISVAIIKKILPGLIIGVIIGNWLLYHLNPLWVKILFTVLIASVGMHLSGIISRYQAITPNDIPVKSWRYMYHMAACFIGGISSILGIGGGTLSVPMITYLGLSIKIAVGSSALLGVFIAFFSVLSQLYYSLSVSLELPFTLGYIHLLIFGIIAIFSTISAPFGAYLAHILPTHILKKIFGLFLIIMSLIFLHDIAQSLNFYTRFVEYMML